MIMTAEVPKERLIKNIGIRPHNLSGSQLQDLLPDSDSEDRLGILMLKPGCFSVAGRTSIQDKTEDLLSSFNLDVIATSCTVLTREQVHRLYPNIYDPDVVAQSARLGELRILMEDYLSNCVFTYMVYGDNSLNELKKIKRLLRQDVIKVGNWDVHNRVHVPEQSDLDQNTDILFNHINCAKCLRQDND